MSDDRLTFGKYSGKKIKDIADWDPDYLRWLASKDDLDEDLRCYIAECLNG